MHALIICDGERPGVELLRQTAVGAELIIATDGAAAWAATAGVEPQVVVGDFDSLVSLDDGWEIVHAGPHDQQENSDAEKAILLALARGATHMTVVGATGRRLDHTLANVWLAARYHEHADIILLDNYSECRVVSDHLRLAVVPGTVVSLMSLTPDVTVRTAGLRWPLDGPLPPGTRSLSNQAVADEVVVEVMSGLVAVVVVRATALVPQGADPTSGAPGCPA